MRNVFVLLLLSATVALGQQVETRQLSSFEEVRSGQAIDVYLKPGSRESVKVEAKGVDLDEVITEVSGGRLKIYLDRNHYNNHVVKVYVTYVNLTAVTASSASNVVGEGIIKGSRLEVSVSSAADIELKVDVDRLEVSASSSGDVELSGRAREIDVRASSAGDVDAYDVEAETAYARASSAGGVKIYVTKEIDARASSGGSVRYRGNPSRSQTDSSSGGSVRKSS